MSQFYFDILHFVGNKKRKDLGIKTFNFDGTIKMF